MLLNERSDEIKVVENFPSSFSNTPYAGSDFSDLTKQICQKYHEGNTNRVFKVIILGDVSVGKTCIVNRFCHEIFNSNYKATIGVDFEIEMFKILGILCTLQIWDTAGQERFKCIAQSYYRGAHAIILVFDLTDLTSLTNCQVWLKEALNAGNTTESVVFLVGNKMDLLSPASHENITKIGGIKMADKLQAEYWSVSAKSGKNIQDFFVRVAALVFDSALQKDKSLLSNDVSDVLLGSNLVSFKKKKKNQASKCVNCKI